MPYVSFGLIYFEIRKYCGFFILITVSACLSEWAQRSRLPVCDRRGALGADAHTLRAGHTRERDAEAEGLDSIK